MKHKALAPPLALFLFLTTTPITRTQTKSAEESATTSVQDWQGLAKLKRGKQVLIELKDDGRSAEGKFVSISGTKLTLLEDGTNVTLEQNEIQRVYRLQGKWSRGTTAKIGAGIGMFVGTLVGAGRMIRLEREVGHVGSDRDTLPAVVGFFVGSLAGAGIGALVGGKRRGKLLYEAK
jgi:hypothetical protein